MWWKFEKRKNKHSNDLNYTACITSMDRKFPWVTIHENNVWIIWVCFMDAGAEIFAKRRKRSEKWVVEKDQSQIVGQPGSGNPWKTPHTAAHPRNKQVQTQLPETLCTIMMRGLCELDNSITVDRCLFNRRWTLRRTRTCHRWTRCRFYPRWVIPLKRPRITHANRSTTLSLWTSRSNPGAHRPRVRVSSKTRGVPISIKRTNRYTYNIRAVWIHGNYSFFNNNVYAWLKREI